MHRNDGMGGNGGFDDLATGKEGGVELFSGDAGSLFDGQVVHGCLASTGSEMLCERVGSHELEAFARA